MPGVKIQYDLIDYAPLLGRMKDRRFTRITVTNAIKLTVGGIDYFGLWKNVRDKKPLDGRVIQAICPILGIKESEIGSFFFQKYLKGGRKVTVK